MKTIKLAAAALAATAAFASSAAMAEEQQVQQNEATAFEHVAQDCAPVNDAVINDKETNIDDAIACAEAIGGYLIQADKTVKSHIDSMAYSFQKGVYANERQKCMSAMNVYASTGHKTDDQNPTKEERRVRATHIDEVSYACLAFNHGNINGDIFERTGTVVLPKENVQTVVGTAYCVADALGTSAWNDGSYDNKKACKEAAPSFSQ